MLRRDFIKLLGVAGFGASSLPWAVSNALAANAGAYNGTIFINFQLTGGIDQSSFIDPKADSTVNTWASSSNPDGGARDAGIAGNIRYAPIAENKAFFEKYYKHMLVVNGVNGQTNSHAAGKPSRWTGRTAAGFPSIMESVSAVHGGHLPMSYLDKSKFKQTIGLMPYTPLPKEDVLRALSTPNYYSANKDYLKSADLDVLAKFEKQRTERLLKAANQTPRFRQLLSEVDLAIDARTLMQSVADNLPNEIDPESDYHIGLLVAQAGLTTTLNYQISGWDMHSDFDGRIRDLLPQLTQAIDYIWEKSAELGIDDRIVMCVQGEIGRTPFYNAGGGKDHWDTTSTLFMQKNAQWGNRVVGASDAGHKSLKINPATLQLDENGIELTSAHIVQAYRELAGIDQNPVIAKYDLNAQSIGLFSKTAQTGYDWA